MVGSTSGDLESMMYPSMDQIDLLKNYSYSFGLCEKNTLQTIRKCKYKCTMNVFP